MAFVAVVTEGSKYATIWIRKNRSKGKKPYTEPLPYLSDVRTIRTVLNYPLYTGYGPSYLDGSSVRELINQLYVTNDGNGWLTTNERNIVHNKALDKMADQLEYVKNLFEAWYERKEAYTLLGGCLKAIATFATRWKDPRYWQQMRKALGVKTRNPSTLPEAWLLWQFALKPLISTIEDISKMLCQDMPIFWVEGVSIINDARKWNYDWGALKFRLMGNSVYGVKHAVRVRTLNPNKQLLNILGLTTPISSYLSVVPWFWAVNYFVNINNFVSNFEDKFPGVNIDKSYTTVFSSLSSGGTVGDRRLAVDKKTLLVKDDMWSVSLSCSYMKRTISTKVPDYKLQYSFPRLGSNQFANLASAIALAFKGKST